jgi:hypothetical protein
MAGGWPMARAPGRGISTPRRASEFATSVIVSRQSDRRLGEVMEEAFVRSLAGNMSEVDRHCHLNQDGLARSGPELNPCVDARPIEAAVQLRLHNSDFWAARSGPRPRHGMMPKMTAPVNTNAIAKTR